MAVSERLLVVEQLLLTRVHVIPRHARQLAILDYVGNPLRSPPEEVLRRGFRPILSYLSRLVVVPVVILRDRAFQQQREANVEMLEQETAVKQYLWKLDNAGLEAVPMDDIAHLQVVVIVKYFYSFRLSMSSTVC